MTVGTLIQALQLAKRVRAYLQSGMPITYRDLVKALRLTLPSGIHQVTEALKLLIGNDIEAGRPLIAAIAIDQVRGGLPTSGFFECAARLGRFCGDAANPEARAFHAAVASWTTSERHGEGCLKDSVRRA